MVQKRHRTMVEGGAKETPRPSLQARCERYDNRSTSDTPLQHRQLGRELKQDDVWTESSEQRSGLDPHLQFE